MGQTIAEAIFEEGWIKGEAEGETKGELKGELKAARRILKQILEKRFGPLPEKMSSDLETCMDLERLNAAVDGALGLDKLKDFHL